MLTVNLNYPIFSAEEKRINVIVSCNLWNSRFPHLGKGNKALRVVQLPRDAKSA